MATAPVAIPQPALPSEEKESLSPNAVSFGHGEEAWLYDPETKRFDLSRRSSNKLIIDADDGVRHHRGCMIDPEKTVLVVIDMQNYFINPKCAKHEEGLAAVKPMLEVMRRCRQESIQIAYLNWVIDDRDMKTTPPAVQRGFCREHAKTHGYGWRVNLGQELPDGQGRCLWRDSWNAELYGPIKEAARPEDLYFDKNRPSGMWDPNLGLHKYLRESGKQTILFCGVNTDQCVQGTLVDSYSHGYDCILIGDCTGTQTGFKANELCQHNVANIYGFVTDSDAFLSAVRV